MTKRFNFNSLADLDDLIAENNRELLANGGPKRDTPEEKAELVQVVAQIKRQNKENAGKSAIQDADANQSNRTKNNQKAAQVQAE